jgi:hypothetical protein
MDESNCVTAGGEFGQQNLPGAFGVDYQFINESAIDFFLGAGVNTIRLPFLLVRLYTPTNKVHIDNINPGANVSDRNRTWSRS